MTRLAPLSLHCLTMSVKYCCSCAYSLSYASLLEMSSLCLVLGLGGSKGQVRMQILASSISLRICGWDISLSMTMPRTSSVSSSRPPGLPSILIRSKFTSWLSKSATESTASTAICAIFRLWMLMILELSVVMAVSTRGVVSSFVKCTTSLILSRCAMATSYAAFLASQRSPRRAGLVLRSAHTNTHADCVTNRSSPVCALLHRLV